MNAKRNRVLAITLLILVNILTVSLFQREVISADEGSTMTAYFVVEKTWKNDTDADGNLIKENGTRNRPTSVNISIVGGPQTINSTLTEAENWRKTFKLPLTDADGKPYTYRVYETTNLDKYETNTDSENMLPIVQIETGRDTGGFEVSKEGFDDVPSPTVRVDSKLKLSEAVREIPESFVYETNQKVYTDPINSNSFNDVDELISYNGDISNGDNTIPGKIVLTWDDKAEDLDGNKYDVRITVSNITIRALADMKGEKRKRIAVLNYDGALSMQSYVADYTSVSKENIVGVKADIKVEILGIENGNYTAVILDDIDIPDQVDCFRDRGTIGNNTYFGLEYPYAESIVINGTPCSDVYINDGKTYLVYDETTQRFASSKNGNDSTMENHYTTLEYLAPATSYSITWAGSCCGTSIVMAVELPEENKYTNKLSNVSSVYMVRYFYQNAVGQYESTPDSVSELRMVKPGTKVEASKQDKTPVKEKADEGYFLDQRDAYTAKWSGTTSESNDGKNPLVLDVYFRKQYVVTYHDNVKDTVFDPQKNPELDYGVPTPGFDTDLKQDGIQAGDPTRQGYKFLGWSEEPDSPIIDVPATVTKNADYWAHWEPGPNKYKVEYYYEVNGKYPTEPDFTSADRYALTEANVSIIDEDKIPVKEGYYLNTGMTAKWTGVVLPNGELVLKVYFRLKPVAAAPAAYTPPVTGIE